MAKNNSSKITDSHSTLSNTAEEIVGYVIKCNEVSKIGIGFIASVPGGRRDLKFTPITGGIKISVRGSGAVQELYLYTKKPELVKKYLVNSFK